MCLKIFLFSFCFFPILISRLYAHSITIPELKNYLSNTVQLHDPGDKSIGTKPFDYFVLDIKPLWNRLGIKIKPGHDRYKNLFGCLQQDKTCYLPEPDVEVIKLGNIEIVRLTKDTLWDFQYFVFLNGNYINQIGFYFQKYEDPKIKLLDKDLFAITVLSFSGSGLLGYETIFYRVKTSGLKKVFSFTSLQERYGWGLIFDESIHSKMSYSNGNLKLIYDITVFMNGDSPDLGYEMTDDLIIKSRKIIALKRNGDSFTTNRSRSNYTLKEIEELASGGYEVYYQAFKSDFDDLFTGDNWTRNWFRLFKKEMKEEMKSVKKSERR